MACVNFVVQRCAPGHCIPMVVVQVMRGGFKKYRRRGETVRLTEISMALHCFEH